MQKKFKLPNVYDLLLALIGVAFCGMGVGFANCAALGLDSIGIFYDGIRNQLGLSPDQLGIASIIVSGVLILFLFFAARKYVSFGTLIYVLGYGGFITVGTVIFDAIVGENDALWIQSLFSILGYLMLYLGIGLYVAIDIGVDAFTGVVLFLTDKTRLEMRYVKIAFDIFLILVGALLGGTFGVATLLTMVAAGPIIQVFSKLFQKLYFRVKHKQRKEEGME